MGFYSRVIFPRLCDLSLDRPFIEEHRRKLLEGVHGNVLEIGFGTGLNIPCYPPNLRKLTVVDPNPGMHRRAEERINRSGMEVEKHILRGERLPFDDGTFDFVVSTFTLCSISAVDAAVGEIHRVLKPGGAFLFLEHGLSPAPRVQKWQRRLNWIQRRIGDNCHLDRDIRGIVSAQPFVAIDAIEFDLDQLPSIFAHLYRGSAVK